MNESRTVLIHDYLASSIGWTSSWSRRDRQTVGPEKYIISCCVVPWPRSWQWQMAEANPSSHILQRCINVGIIHTLRGRGQSLNIDVSARTSASWFQQEEWGKSATGIQPGKAAPRRGRHRKPCRSGKKSCGGRGGRRGTDALAKGLGNTAA